MGSQHHRGRRIKPSRVGSDLSDKLGMVSECVSAHKDREIAVHRGVLNDRYRSSGSFELPKAGRRLRRRRRSIFRRRFARRPPLTLFLERHIPAHSIQKLADHVEAKDMGLARHGDQKRAAVPVLPSRGPGKLHAIHQHLKSTDAEGHIEEVAEILLPQFAEMERQPGR